MTNEMLFDIAHALASHLFEDATKAKGSQELTDKLHVLRMTAVDILGCMIFNSKSPENCVNGPIEIEDLVADIRNYEEFYKQTHSLKGLTRAFPEDEKELPH